MDEETINIGCSILLLIFVILLCGIGGYFVSAYKCDNQWATIPHEYGMIKGCMINPNGKGFIPQANYRVL